MQNLKILLKEIEREIDNHSLVKEEVVDKFPFFLAAINDFLQKVKNCKNIDESTFYFDQLQEMHLVLAKLCFQENMELPKELRKFVWDCDRLDDPWLRDSLFKKTKKNEYSLDNNTRLF